MKLAEADLYMTLSNNLALDPVDQYANLGQAFRLGERLALERLAAAQPAAGRASDWVDCPVCHESDMRKDGEGLIHCVNLNCASNGGDMGAPAVRAAVHPSDALGVVTEWLHVPTLKLRAGEMSAQEVRTVKAVLTSIRTAIEHLLAKRAEPTAFMWTEVDIQADFPSGPAEHNDEVCLDVRPPKAGTPYTELFDHPPPERPAVTDEIRKRLTQLQVGGCTCLTKTPALEYHDERCRYRLASEIEQLLMGGERG